MTDTSYTSDDLSSRFVRLQTNLTFDDRPELKRVVAGDFFASSGDLGSTVNMGGFSLSKSYRMDPYFTKYPTLNVSGLSETASDVEVYVDDIKLRSDKVAPGGFDLRNIAYTTGAHKVEVLIRDAFGNVQRIVHPFYQTDKMLKKGLHEYSYNGGLIRKSYGAESNTYGHAAFALSTATAMRIRLPLALRPRRARAWCISARSSSFRYWTWGWFQLPLSPARANPAEALPRRSIITIRARIQARGCSLGGSAQTMRT